MGTEEIVDLLKDYFVKSVIECDLSFINTLYHEDSIYPYKNENRLITACQTNDFREIELSIRQCLHEMWKDINKSFPYYRINNAFNFDNDSFILAEHIISLKNNI